LPGSFFISKTLFADKLYGFSIKNDSVILEIKITESRLDSAEGNVFLIKSRNSITTVDITFHYISFPVSFQEKTEKGCESGSLFRTEKW
jgi:hypothetical protein